MSAVSPVQKVRNFCRTLRDDGVGYGDYLEQLTYLVLLKLAHEYAGPPYHRATQVPEGNLAAGDHRPPGGGAGVVQGCRRGVAEAVSAWWARPARLRLPRSARSRC
jgi:hypothetical protein